MTRRGRTISQSDSWSKARYVMQRSFESIITNFTGETFGKGSTDDIFTGSEVSSGRHFLGVSNLKTIFYKHYRGMIASGEALTTFLNFYKNAGLVDTESPNKMTSDWSMGGHNINQCADPVKALDIATKKYVDSALQYEIGFYSGNSSAGRTINLANSSLQIEFIMIICGSDTTNDSPVVKSTLNFGTNESRDMNGVWVSNGDLIRSIATVGQFQVGSQRQVNKSPEEYSYYVIGTV